MRALKGITINVVLVGIIALDVLLVVAAVHHSRSSTSTQAVPVTSLVPAASPPPASAATGRAAARRGTNLLSFSTRSDGWRAHGGCKGSPHLRATTDGGRIWTALAAPAPHVLRIQMTSASAGWLVGATAACAPTLFSTSNGGTTWAASVGLGQTWVVVRDKVRRPDGSNAAPCGPRATPRALAPASTSAAIVVCPSGAVLTTDGGATWRPVAGLPPGGHPVAAALEPGASGRGLLVVSGDAACGGLEVLRTADFATTWKVATCLDGLAAPASVSLAPDNAAVIIARGGAARSTDSGRSWT